MTNRWEALVPIPKTNQRSTTTTSGTTPPPAGAEAPRPTAGAPSSTAWPSTLLVHDTLIPSLSAPSLAPRLPPPGPVRALAPAVRDRSRRPPGPAGRAGQVRRAGAPRRLASAAPAAVGLAHRSIVFGQRSRGMITIRAALEAERRAQLRHEVFLVRPVDQVAAVEEEQELGRRLSRSGWRNRTTTIPRGLLPAASAPRHPGAYG